MKGVEVTLDVKSEVKPKKNKPRSVPYILKQKVADELDRLCNLGIISPVKTAKWATPIVPVVKKDGTIRICGDFKSTVNQATHIETYPLPRVEELFSNLAGGKYFSKLDMSSAYLQLLLAVLSKEYLTINTHGDFTSLTDYHSVWHLHRQSFSVPWRHCYVIFLGCLCIWMIFLSQAQH